MLYKYKSEKFYVPLGLAAIILGGVISAFWAKQPSTFVMWASAYLVLIVGMAQIFFGTVINKLVKKNTKQITYWWLGLFNTGNVLVITSTALKYSGYERHMAITWVGSLFIVTAFMMLGRQILSAQPSRLKNYTYVVLSALIASVLIGLILAHYF